MMKEQESEREREGRRDRRPRRGGYRTKVKDRATFRFLSSRSVRKKLHSTFLDLHSFFSSPLSLFDPRKCVSSKKEGIKKMEMWMNLQVHFPVFQFSISRAVGENQEASEQILFFLYSKTAFLSSIQWPDWKKKRETIKNGEEREMTGWWVGHALLHTSLFEKVMFFLFLTCCFEHWGSRILGRWSWLERVLLLIREREGERSFHFVPLLLSDRVQLLPFFLFFLSGHEDLKLGNWDHENWVNERFLMTRHGVNFTHKSREWANESCTFRTESCWPSLTLPHQFSFLADQNEGEDWQLVADQLPTTFFPLFTIHFLDSSSCPWT